MTLMGAAMRLSVRPMMRRANDPAQVRQRFERAARRSFRPVPHACVIRSKAPTDGLWVSAGQVTSSKVLLYFHGGGYIAGSPETHAQMVARLCRMTGMRAFLPRYRLAPENPLPAAFDDARAAFDGLVARGYAAPNIVIGGDSAGGGLALSLLSALCQRGTPPAAAFAWSPFCDQTFSGASVLENGARDHFFPPERVHELSEMILGDLAAEDPRASPLLAPFPNCPPVLLQVSDSEILRDDARRMAAHLRAQGTMVTLQEWAGAPHVWQIFDGWFPEARQAIRATSRFLAEY